MAKKHHDVNSWEEEDVKRGREQYKEGHKGHAEALFDDAHDSYNWKGGDDGSEPFHMQGSFMSKHAGNSYFHKERLLDDMPIDDHAGTPLNQNKPSGTTVYSDRLNEKGQSQFDILNKAAGRFNDYTKLLNNTRFTSKERLDKANKKYTDLKSNLTRKTDSVNAANAKMNKLFPGIDKQRTKLNKQQDDILSGKY